MLQGCTETTACDPDLIAQAQAGDAAAFEQLYHAHVGRIYAICLRMVADPVRAERLTQDAFVRAWQRLGSFRGESAFYSWLYRLAVNVVLVDLRTERRRKARMIPSDNMKQYDRAGPGAMPEADMDLEEGIASLPTRARAVLVLHDIEGYRHEEIGEMMGIATGTSKAHLHRARNLLKEKLAGYKA